MNMSNNINIAKKVLKNPLNITSLKNLNLANVILVRHAESEFNKSIRSIEKKAEIMSLPKKEFREMQKLISGNKEFIDSPITDLGIDQCKKAAMEIANVPIKYVFVSPMRRCLETCRIILENKINLNLKNQTKTNNSSIGIINKNENNAYADANKSNLNKSTASQFNFSTAENANANSYDDDNHLHLKQIMKENKFNIKVIVHPYLFEKIEDSCDLIGDIYQNRDDYNYFDWSLFNNTGFDKNSILFYQSKFCDNINNNEINLNENEAKRELENYYFETIKNEIFKTKINDRQKIKELYHDTIVSGINKLFDQEIFIESSFQTLERLNYFKEFILNFMEMKRIGLDEQTINEKILVIGHSVLFKHFTSNYLSEEDFSPGPNEYKLSNCEFLGVKMNL